jgi:hypothetical protein
MSHFRGGPNMNVQFIDASGTIALVSQYKTVTISDEGDMIDSSAGTVTFREFIAGLRKWSVKYEGLNNGEDTPLGTADIARMAPTTGGTIRISPFGTVVGKRRYSGGVLISKRDLDYPYDDVCTSNFEFQGSGALTEDLW